MKKALVLGACGFIGGHLIEALKKEGYWVRGADINYMTKPLQYQPQDFMRGNTRDIHFMESVFEVEGNFDEVYQLSSDMGGAVFINSGIHDGDVMMNSVTINANCAKCCIKFHVKKLFFPSSACVYPNVVGVAECREEDAYPAFPDNEYGWEKLFTERMYKSVERQYGYPIVRIARFHSIVGDYATYKSNRSKAHAALAYKMALAQNNDTIEVIGDGEQIRTFLYVKDCVDGIRKLMDSDCGDPINIGSDHRVTINEYVHILMKISNKKVTIKHVSGPTGVKERYCDITKAKQLIGWEPTTDLYESTTITYNYICDNL
jgi:GDP-D-mannose 3',5'-epimerase